MIAAQANNRTSAAAISTSRQTTWNEFLQALNAPVGQDFNPFYWIFRLSIALLDTIVPCRNHDRRRKLHRSMRYLSHVIPAVGMMLTVLCGWSYYSVFRYSVVQKRWCSTPAIHDCNWEKVHGSLVLFFMVNILGHYLWCTFKSPGVVEKESDCNKSSSYYVNSSNNQPSSITYHPDPNPSHCNKCEKIRPARAHHCRICNKCILQYDHHCPWVNNCIGRNNYRSFVLLVFYLLVGCTYGVFMLGLVFYEMMKIRFETYGWSIRGAVHGTGLLDLPLPWVLWREYLQNGYIDQDVVLRAAFPLMAYVGVFMYWFLGYHMKIIIHGLTTLEQTARPQFKTINPFDSGPRNNLIQVFGTSWIRFLLPLPFHPDDQLWKSGATPKDH